MISSLIKSIRKYFKNNIDLLIERTNECDGINYFVDGYCFILELNDAKYDQPPIRYWSNFKTIILSLELQQIYLSCESETKNKFKQYLEDKLGMEIKHII